jgi:hypothetical protein
MTTEAKVMRVAEQAKRAAKEQGLSPKTYAFANFCRGQWQVATSIDPSLTVLKHEYMRIIGGVK